MNITKRIVNRLHNVGIRVKLIALITPLVAVLLLFSGGRIYEKARLTRELRGLQDVTRAALLARKVVADLEAERALNALYMGGKKKFAAKKLKERRRLLDISVRELIEYLKRLEGGDDRRRILFGYIHEALDRLKLINEIREGIASGKVSFERQTEYYSGAIRLVLLGMKGLGRDTKVQKSRYGAYVSIMEAQERIGLRSTLLTYSLASNVIGSDLYRKYVAADSQESVFLEQFALYSDPTPLKIFRDSYFGPLAEQIERIENAFKTAGAQGGHLTGISAEHWWSSSQERLRTMGKVDALIAAGLRKQSQNLESKARLELFIFSTLFIIFILATVFFSYVLHRVIVRPLTSLSRRMSDFDYHNIEVQAPKKKRYDEIGTLNTHFYDMGLKLKHTLDTLEDEVRIRTLELKEVNIRLSKYLSPQLYKKVFSGDQLSELHHKRKKLTVFFSDIVGFTETTERMDPEELSALLNSYLDEMAGIANQWGGTIDKFVGDAIMVFFGDPEFFSDKNHALRCVSMSLHMNERLREMRREWANRGVTNPFRIRIGINTGYCTIGNFGSESRMDYTIIGNQVNLASRLHDNCEPDQIVVSQATYNLIKDDFDCHVVGEFQYKGIEHPVRVYEVTGPAREGAREKLQESRDGFHIDLDPEELTDEEKRDTRRILKRAYRLVATREELARLEEKRKLKKADPPNRK